MYTIQTVLGDIELSPNCYDHIYIEGKLTVRNTLRRFFCHFFKWSDGQWHLGEEKEEGYKQLRQFFFRDDGTDAARTKILSVICPVINEWTSQHQGILDETNKEELQIAINNRLERIKTHNDAIAALGKEITRLNGGERLLRYSDVK